MSASVDSAGKRRRHELPEPAQESTASGNSATQLPFGGPADGEDGSGPSSQPPSLPPGLLVTADVLEVLVRLLIVDANIRARLG